MADWSWNGKDKRRIVYLTKVSGTETVLSRKWISPQVRQIQYRKKLFKFDPSVPGYRSKNTLYYFVDVDIGQLRIETVSEPRLSPELSRLVIKKEIVKQLIGSLETTPLLGNIVMTLLGIGMGIAIGFILGNAFPL